MWDLSELKDRRLVGWLDAIAIYQQYRWCCKGVMIDRVGERKKHAISNMMQLPGVVDNSHGGKNSFTNLCYATFLTKGHKVF